MPTFVEAVRSGDAVLADIDDWIDAWHVAPNNSGPLHAYLGLTWEEYAAFAERPSSLDEILRRKVG
jgi:hypothetical protein